jgi:EmrB/QacA subfamily drug resistance transporter
VANEQENNTGITGKGLGINALPRRQVLITLAGVMLAMFLSSLDQTVVGTAMPQVITDLGGFTQYTWVTTIYIITSTIAIPITGKLTDMYGRKWFYVGGIAIFIVGSLLSGFSQNMTQLILFRGFQGIGAGIMMANAFTVIGDIFPPAERGKYQGLMAGTFGLSSIIGPTLGGYITDTLSWHWVFFVNIPLGVLIVVLFIFFFPHLKPDQLKHKIDYLGITTLTLAVVPMLIALTWGGVEYPWGSARIIGMFAFSAAMTLLFILFESRAEEPIIPLWLFKNPIVGVSMFIMFITGFGMFGGIIFIPLFFQGVLGQSATHSGTFLTPMMLGLVAGSIISGQLLSRAGGHYRLLGMIGLGVLALGLWLLSQMSAETSNARAITNIVVTGFGLGITMPLYVLAIQNAVPYSALGTATSSAAFFRSISGAFGLTIFGTVMNNRFASEFTAELPSQVKEVMPASQLDSIVHNPQALFSTDATDQLKSFFEQLPQGMTLFNQLMHTLKSALNSGITEVFFLAFILVAVGWVANFFLKEIPLAAVSYPPSRHSSGDNANVTIHE